MCVKHWQIMFWTREGEVGGNAHSKARFGRKKAGLVGSVTLKSREAQTIYLREGSELASRWNPEQLQTAHGLLQ